MSLTEPKPVAFRTVLRALLDRSPSHVTGLGLESLLNPISFGSEPEGRPKKALDHHRCDEAVVAYESVHQASVLQVLLSKPILIGVGPQ